MRTRILSGAVLIVILFTCLYFGGWVTYGFSLFISLVGMYELIRVKKIEKTGLAVVGYAAAVMYYIILLMNDPAYILLLLVATCIIMMSVYIFTFPKYKTEDVMWVFFSIIYVAVMLSYIYQIRIEVGGVFKVWLVFICAWGCDTCAYCVGMLIGKHKLAPILSPKKSIEGGIGGILGAALIGVLYGLAINYWGNAAADILEYAIIGAIGGAISQIGDLAASAIKRYHNIKDYGKLIPGHGGILDRFDSVIFTAPIIFYLSLFL